MTNYLAAEASPEAIAAEALAFLAFLAFLGLADASPEAIAAEAAGAEAAGAEAEAEAANAEVANMLAIKTAINFSMIFPWWVKKLLIHLNLYPITISNSSG